MICRLCLGKPLGFIQNHTDMFQFQKTVEDRLPIVEKFAVLGEVNVLVRILSRTPVLWRLLPSTKDKEGIGAIVGVRYP